MNDKLESTPRLTRSVRVSALSWALLGGCLLLVFGSWGYATVVACSEVWEQLNLAVHEFWRNGQWPPLDFWMLPMMMLSASLALLGAVLGLVGGLWAFVVGVAAWSWPDRVLAHGGVSASLSFIRRLVQFATLLALALLLEAMALLSAMGGVGLVVVAMALN